MGEENGKRKHGQGEGGPAFKKSKGGNGGKWSTTNYQSKMADKVDRGVVLAVNDEGIWVTCARGMKARAAREFQELCEEYGESMYGIKPREDPDEAADDGEDASGDIEDQIKRDLEKMKSSAPKPRHVFSVVHVDIECVFFVKTLKPVEPKELVLRICRDARACSSPTQRRLKYVNRLSPVTDTDKASENGIIRVARAVMSPYLALRDESPREGDAQPPSEEKGQAQAGDGTAPYTFALRTSVRSHTVMKSSEIIQKIAQVVDPKHKVNLSKPDKSVLVEVFQSFCGMSVVDGPEFEALKRYNVNEIYRLAFEDLAAKEEEAKEKSDS
ncbi:unnamed protein product [Clonostachys rhizophaga]|uniref:THUMP domain-containing protein n=1 Tax=Clonostachys rhizophaga TaxID=160324 RepID=A0A9N9UYM0_9HYPO|nr:unnamed protein product [Clonostachys rhizophaga]